MSAVELQLAPEPTLPTDHHSEWGRVWTRLRRNRAALVSGFVFLLVLLACFPGATLWADHVAHTTPDTQNLAGTIRIDGRNVPVVSNQGTPIGPGLRGRYLLGADGNGRDLLVRVLYGGRTSLVVGLASAALCMAIGLLLALVAGFFGGAVDGLISRVLDLLWSLPVYLLAVALAAALAAGGLVLGPIHLSSGSLLIPIFVIGLVTVPYVARPLRAQVMALRHTTFVEASVSYGSSPLRIMRIDLLPSLMPTVVVLFSLVVATNILTEAALSFLGVGVAITTPSWGNVIHDGYRQVVTAPALTIVPGVAIMITAVALNVFGDGLRDAIDPRAKLPVGADR